MVSVALRRKCTLTAAEKVLQTSTQFPKQSRPSEIHVDAATHAIRAAAKTKHTPKSARNQGGSKSLSSGPERGGVASQLNAMKEDLLPPKALLMVEPLGVAPKPLLVENTENQLRNKRRNEVKRSPVKSSLDNGNGRSDNGQTTTPLEDGTSGEGSNLHQVKKARISAQSSPRIRAPGCATEVRVCEVSQGGVSG